jgi:hypothetical protein
MALAVARGGFKSLLDLYDLAVSAIGGRDGEQVHLPRGLAGSFETAQMDHVHK